MSKTDSIDAFSLIRIGTFSAELERLHLWGTDEEIDREFNSVCRTIWGYTLDDFDDDSISREDHDWLDDLAVQLVGGVRSLSNGYSPASCSP
jgi:hypothetical protein